MSMVTVKIMTITVMVMEVGDMVLEQCGVGCSGWIESGCNADFVCG